MAVKYGDIMDLKLKKLNIPSETGNYKASTHATGKIGFTKIAAERMKLNENKYLEFAINEVDSNDKNLYVFVRNDTKEGLLKVNRAGAYYHVNAKRLLEQFQLDYRTKRIIFDISEIKYENETVYKFSRRVKEREKKSTN